MFYEAITLSSVRDVEVIKKTRTQIDKELANLSALKACRNALAPISRLPPELLSTIFTYTASASIHSEWLPESRLYPFWRRPMAWMKVTQVCRRWRAVALQCPMLWTHICLSDYHLTRKMLRRSKNLPIFVESDLSSRRNSRLFQAMWIALDHLPRIQALHIRSSLSQLQRIFTKLTGPAPILESLHISKIYNRHTAGGDVFTVPAHLFHGNLPRLRRIQLRGCNFEWASPNLSHLTHLEVCGSATSHRVDASTVLTVLQATPLLEVLCLENCVTDSTAIVSTREPVILDHLSHLRLDEDSFRIISYLQFRALASLKLHSSEIDSSVELSRLLSTITTYFVRMPDNDQLQVRSLLVEIGPTHIAMQGWTMAYSSQLHDSFIEPVQIDLELLWSDGSQRKGLEVMTVLLKDLPIIKLEKLELHLGDLGPISAEVWSTGMWMELLRGSKIQSVRLHEPGETISTLLRALIPGFAHFLSNMASPGYQPLSDPEVFLPELAEIWILSTDFRKPVVAVPFLDFFEGALHQTWTWIRRALNSMELTISKCSNISEDDVIRLKKFITVDWDGEDTARVDEEPGSVDIPEWFWFSEEEEEDFWCVLRKVRTCQLTTTRAISSISLTIPLRNVCCSLGFLCLSFQLDILCAIIDRLIAKDELELFHEIQYNSVKIYGNHPLQHLQVPYSWFSTPLSSQISNSLYSDGGMGVDAGGRRYWSRCRVCMYVVLREMVSLEQNTIMITLWKYFHRNIVIIIPWPCSFVRVFMVDLLSYRLWCY